MRVLAVDPGKMSGIAFIARPNDDDPPIINEFPAMKSVKMAEQYLGTNLDFVVCESFIPRPGAGTWQPDALEVIGALRYLCWRCEVPFELQSPADAKRFSTDEKLKKLGWYTPTPDGHANDAQRHLLLGLVRHQEIDLRRLT